MIFVNSEINEIELEALFFGIFNTNCNNLDLQVKRCCSKNDCLGAEQILQRPIFKFHEKQHSSAMLMRRALHQSSSSNT